MESGSASRHLKFAAAALGATIALCLVVIGYAKCQNMARAIDPFRSAGGFPWRAVILLAMQPAADFALAGMLAASSYFLKRRPESAGTIGLAAAGIIFWAYLVFGLNFLDTLTEVILVLLTVYVGLLLAGTWKNPGDPWKNLSPR